ncbi:MAG TPA: secretin N-terminal domain-containing protein [candidate division Zixibacteria bacterium]|nr:secretin N-terminal domain-containing protein [candidate division Zixibacteria bacterium]
MLRIKFKKLLLSAVFIIVSLGLLAVVFAQDNESPEEPIKNLQFQSADIRSVLRFLADYGNVNVVVAPEVDGTVTIKLSNIHWRTAMEIIGKTYDLTVVDESAGYIRVVTSEHYRKEQSEAEKHKKEQRELVELETRIIKISNSGSDDIVKTAKSLLTERGEAISDSRSNSIILREVPANLERVVGYINELDKPAKQIKISSQLLEVFTNDLNELGISWDAQGTYTRSSGVSYPQSGEVLTKRNSDVAGRYTINALQKGWSVELIVEAIVSSGKGKIIAHPEITTVENKKAKIQLGQKVPVKQFDESGNVVIKFEEVGTILNVIPHITAENQILMYLKPERSTYQFDPNGVIINTSNAETNIIVENGQTAVIGGLTTQDEVSSEIGVPVLKDIPIIGLLFKYKQTKTESRDLVIFVTPTIVEEDLAMGG